MHSIPSCREHGVMRLRADRHGIWYECERCPATVLEPSKELLAALAAVEAPQVAELVEWKPPSLCCENCGHVNKGSYKVIQRAQELAESWHTKAVDADVRMEAAAARAARAIQIGDLMRFSVELLREIAAMPDRSTELVEVVKIETEPDATKMVWLKRASKQA